MSAQFKRLDQAGSAAERRASRKITLGVQSRIIRTMDRKSRITLEFDKVLERLASYTSFSAGESLALQLEPTHDEDEARQWQAETQEAFILLDKRADVIIGGARDVRRAADNALRGFILPPDDLLEIRATVSSGLELRRKLIKAQEDYPHLAMIGELIEECPGLVSSINGALDERGGILDTASVKLADIRRDLRVIQDRIQDKLRSLLNSGRSQYLQEPTITTRGGRYVVPLMANHKGRIKGIVHDQSNSGATLWIEPINTVDLNNEYRGLEISEEEEIQRILAELSSLVAQHGDAIKRIVERLAELDLIFARASYAQKTNAVMPLFVPWRDMEGSDSLSNEDNIEEEERSVHPGSTVWIRGARHPLLDLETVVPTDILVPDDVFLVLITGPNTGGKTVSLKTTGLMILMAQSGLHLPAVEARLTVFDDVFADIGDEQSIEQNLSTFSGHLTNIVLILAHADDRSLVVFDELGSGTDPAEGAALAQSIVGYLKDLGVTTFIATHFPELKAYASNVSGAVNASLLFDVETLMPTFEMSIGMPGRSNAFAIARRLGLEETILEDAVRIIGTSSSRAESLLDSLYELREKITSDEALTRLALKQAQEERDLLEGRLEGIHAERKKILEEAHEQAKLELDAVRKEIRKVRKQLRDAESINKLKKIQKQTEVIEDKELQHLEQEIGLVDELSAPKKKKRRPADFRVGDRVKVRTLGAKGQIAALDKREAEVVVGRLHMRLRLDELEFVERPDDQPADDKADSSSQTSSSASSTGGSKRRIASPGMELDLRGLRVDEGLNALDKYLDAAFLANLPWVRIIHGKGTGRMREAVRKALSSNTFVTGWEEGRDGEGGAGVTVAKLDIE
jgi:DNA mismatch repair protein MutS2